MRRSGNIARGVIAAAAAAQFVAPVAQAASCIDYRNLQETVIANFDGVRMEKMDNGLRRIAGVFPEAEWCVPRAKIDAKSTGRVMCFWVSNADQRFDAVATEIEQCFSGWERRNRQSAAGLRQTLFVRQPGKDAVWIVEIQKISESKHSLMLAYMQ